MSFAQNIQCVGAGESENGTLGEGATLLNCFRIEEGAGCCYKDEEPIAVPIPMYEKSD